MIIKFLIFLFIIYGFLFLGYGTKRSFPQLTLYSRPITVGILIYITPIIILNSFWSLDFTSMSIAQLPIINILIMTLSLFPALLISHLLKLNKKEKGSFISCTLFSNIGLTLGGFLCFIIYGESGLYLAGLFTALFLPYYYLVGFPIMSVLSNEKNITMRTAIAELITNPVSIVPITSMVFGLIFNIAGMERPQILNEISTRWLIYITTAGNAFGIGLGWNFQKTSKFIKHALLISSIKFIYNPLVGFFFMYLFGYLKLENLMPAKVIFIESFMPAAIMSVVMVKIFKLDDDLSNSAWILTNLFSVPVIPLMIMISRLIWST